MILSEAFWLGLAAAKYFWSAVPDQDLVCPETHWALLREKLDCSEIGMCSVSD